jgi:hypothetical protein
VDPRLIVARAGTWLSVAGIGLALAGCDQAPWNKKQDATPVRAGVAAASATAPAASAPAPSGASPPAAGVTPMGERVAVLGFLNKRNGISQDLTMKPGQAVRVRDDVIVRLKACETTPPWQFDRWTGAFVQVDVRQPDERWKRVFSGWLYKESPSLNVVEHPVYDVWPKSCVMTFPDAATSADKSGVASRSSKADQSAGGEAGDAGDSATDSAAR